MGRSSLFASPLVRLPAFVARLGGASDQGMHCRWLHPAPPSPLLHSTAIGYTWQSSLPPFHMGPRLALRRWIWRPRPPQLAGRGPWRQWVVCVANCYRRCACLWQSASTVATGLPSEGPPRLQSTAPYSAITDGVAAAAAVAATPPHGLWQDGRVGLARSPEQELQWCD